MNKGLEFLLIALFYFFNFLLKITPDRVVRWISNFIAFLAFHFNKKHKNIILKNLEYFCKIAKKPQSLEITKRVYKKYAYYILSLVKNQGISKEALMNKIEVIKNDFYLQELLDRNEKIVFTTAHFGNWELLPPAIAIKFGIKVSIVGRALEIKTINDYLTKNREKFNVELIEKTGALRHMLKAMKNGSTVGIVSDQDAHINESCVLKLYGKDVTQSNAASILAKRCDAYIVPIYIYELENKKNCLEIFKPLKASDYEIEELSEYQLECTKKMWEKHPDEYFWFHKRFKTFYEDEY